MIVSRTCSICTTKVRIPHARNLISRVIPIPKEQQAADQNCTGPAKIWRRTWDYFISTMYSTMVREFFIAEYGRSRRSEKTYYVWNTFRWFTVWRCCFVVLAGSAIDIRAYQRCVGNTNAPVNRGEVGRWLYDADITRRCRRGTVSSTYAARATTVVGRASASKRCGCGVNPINEDDGVITSRSAIEGDPRWRSVRTGWTRAGRCSWTVNASSAVWSPYCGKRSRSNYRSKFSRLAHPVWPSGA